MGLARYIGHCTRVQVRELRLGSVRRDPVTGHAIMPPRGIGAFGDAFAAFFAPLEGSGRQRVVVLEEPDSRGIRRTYFQCECGARALTLYRAPDADRFTCKRCSHISYAPPKPTERRYSKAELQGIIDRGEAADLVAALKGRLDRARRRPTAPGNRGISQLISANRERR